MLGRAELEPDLAALGFHPFLLSCRARRKPFVIYVRLNIEPPGVYTFSCNNQGVSYKWGRDTELISRYGYRLIDTRSVRWRIWRATYRLWRRMWRQISHLLP